VVESLPARHPNLTAFGSIVTVAVGLPLVALAGVLYAGLWAEGYERVVRLFG
jgi:hypothetical protein